MFNESIFWIDVDKIKPNPYQPRKQFNEDKLRELAESIRQYGVLQPLIVTRKEFEKEDGGLGTEYELIAGERRLRASRIAGVSQVPVVIRTGTEEENNRLKLELALIENIQREDLSPVDRAQAFKQLIDEFQFKHTQVASRIGKSREYVSNSIRLLSLPEEIIEALSEGKINEGHTRPLLMLTERPEEQITLFKDIIYRKLNVREAERIARGIAVERARKPVEEIDPELRELEAVLAEELGTRVQIEKRENGGKLTIDFFTPDDLRALLARLNNESQKEISEEGIPNKDVVVSEENSSVDTEVESPEEDEDLYSVRNFTI